MGGGMFGWLVGFPVNWLQSAAEGNMQTCAHNLGVGLYTTHAAALSGFAHYRNIEGSSPGSPLGRL